MEVEGAEIQAPSDHAELKNDKDKQESARGSSSKKRVQKEFAFSSLDRPTRERKSIERLIVSPDKEVKEFKIGKGSGTALKDIPNIVFKISKRRKGDEIVQALHKVLFGRTSAKLAAKKNILQFSGFVWSGDEEKEKAKVKERLEKSVKENISQISDLLDLSLSKSLKKEDTVLKILEFLESPCKTTNKLVEESVKPKRSKKAKKPTVKASKTKAPEKSPKKGHKSAKKTSRKKQGSDEEEESDAAEVDEDIEEEPEDKSDDDYAKESSSAKKRKRKSPKKAAVQESEDKEEPLPKKKKPRKEVKKEPIQEAKKEKKPTKKAPTVATPSDEDLREAICELLQNADFSKVTFTDVMKQLGGKFNADLTPRKALLKSMIQEEIHKLVGEGDNEDEDGDNEGGNDDHGDEANGNEQQEHVDASGDVKVEDADNEDASGELKAEDEEEDGDANIAEDNGNEERDSDDVKSEGDNENKDRNSTEVRPDDEVEDAKEGKGLEDRAEDDTADMAA